MIKNIIAIGNRDVFIDISETQEESAGLENLARQVKYFSANFKRTGLYLALEYRIGNNLALALCLNRPIELSAAQEKILVDTMLKLTIK